MKKMSFLLFLSMILTNSLSALAESSPEGEEAEEEEEVALITTKKVAAFHDG